MKFTKNNFVEAIPVPHFQFFLQNQYNSFKFMHVNVDKPQSLYSMRNLQFQPSTTCIKMHPLQNQEPVIAHPCRHLSCPKKWFWRTSTEWGTCHKSSKGFSLQNQGAQHSFFGALLWISEPLASTKWETWHGQTCKQNGYLEQRKPSKIKDPFCKGVMWKNFGLPWKPWNLQRTIL